MSSEPTTPREELVMRDIEMWNTGETDAVDDLYADGSTYIDPMGEAHDHESYAEYIDAIRTAFPDFHVDVREFCGTGDVVAVRYTFGGTLEGPYRGFEPTGGSFELHGVAWYRIEDGAIVEAWNATNPMSIAQQVGALG
ncbi:MAG: ester cyclase [Haloferacaceae archaeon]